MFHANSFPFCPSIACLHSRTSQSYDTLNTGIRQDGLKFVTLLKHLRRNWTHLLRIVQDTGVQSIHRTNSWKFWKSFLPKDPVSYTLFSMMHWLCCVIFLSWHSPMKRIFNNAFRTNMIPWLVWHCHCRADRSSFWVIIMCGYPHVEFLNKLLLSLVRQS